MKKFLSILLALTLIFSCTTIVVSAEGEVEGEGDYDRAKTYAAENGVVRPSLQKDLDVIAGANIPVDIRCVQGAEVLGL